MFLFFCYSVWVGGEEVGEEVGEMSFFVRGEGEL